MTSALSRALDDFDWIVLVYFFAINSSYLLLVVLATGNIVEHSARRSTRSYEDSFVNPLAPAVSIILPTYNEEAVIATSVAAALSLRYAELEVIVVLDGPTDDTFVTLQRSFDLVEVPCRFPALLPTRAAPLAKFVPRGDAPLVVITKANSGRADSVNVGINSARHPLICMVDADSILDPEALLRVAQPFLDDPERVVATGGVIRAVNGCHVRYGRVLEVRMPSSWLARIQVAEYLLAFLLGRAGWSRLGSLLVISGAFGLFRRDVVLAVGGLDATCIGEDAELVVRIHRWFREQRREYRIVFVTEPVSWTEVPESLAVLARQRRRWARGLAEVIWRHRRMIGNPRYGRVGMLALPYYVVFELFAPVVQLIGIAAVVLALALGTLDWVYGGLFLAVAVGYGLVLSTAALAVEELTFHRYSRWRDLLAALAGAVLQNVGFRQLAAIWQLQGMWAAICGREARWGVMERTGFTLDEAVDGETA